MAPTTVNIVIPTIVGLVALIVVVHVIYPEWVCCLLGHKWKWDKEASYIDHTSEDWYHCKRCHSAKKVEHGKLPVELGPPEMEDDAEWPESGPLEEYNPPEEEPEPVSTDEPEEAESEAMRCGNCGSKDIDHIHYTMPSICKDCGTVTACESIIYPIGSIHSRNSRKYKILEGYYPYEKKVRWQCNICGGFHIKQARNAHSEPNHVFPKQDLNKF